MYYSIASEVPLPITMLHEYVHYGDLLSGVEYYEEEGKEFEKMVYGVVVGRTNAYNIFIKLYGRPK